MEGQQNLVDSTCLCAHILLHQTPTTSVEAHGVTGKGNLIYHVTRNSPCQVGIRGGSSSRFSFLMEGPMERIHH